MCAKCAGATKVPQNILGTVSGMARCFPELAISRRKQFGGNYGRRFIGSITSDCRNLGNRQHCRFGCLNSEQSVVDVVRTALPTHRSDCLVLRGTQVKLSNSLNLNTTFKPITK